MRRAGRLFVENLPNPLTDTVSPFARASRMTSNTALTALFAWAFVSGARPATWAARSVFLMSPPPEQHFFPTGGDSTSSCFSLTLQ